MTLTAVEGRQPERAGQPDAGRAETVHPDLPRAPREVMREGFYTLQLDSGPWFNLYIMPIQTAGNDRRDYQALFN